LSQGTTRLIWAFHESQDPTEECFDSSSITMHTNMGSQSINLDSGVPQEIELEDDVEYYDFVMDKVQVPSSDTTYYCKLFKIPTFNDTRHIVKFEPIVEEGNEGLVHHLVVFDCPEYLVTNESHIGTEGVCDEWDTNMPSSSCRQHKQIYLWAIGGNDLYMPESAGMSISGDSDFHYLLIEMHYDNPLEKSDIVDSSGFRMYYTQTLREQEVGIFQVGLSVNSMAQWIPAGLDYAHNAAFMTSECSTNAFPEDGIKVFGSALHAHSIGRAMNIRHIRNGTELTPIDVNLDYDFNYQQTITFEEPIMLLPGDSFILDCWTNSSSRNFVTIGGESTSEEMCQAHLWYYPAIDLYGALSQKTPSAMGQWMKDAQIAGYLNGTSDDVDEIFDSGDSQFGPFDFSSLYYDTTIDGADEFYDRLYSVEDEKYNKHMYWCYYFDGDEYVIYNSEFMNISRSEDFIEYDLSVGNCTSTENEGDISGVCVASEYTPSPIEDSDSSNEGGFTANLSMVCITSLILIMMV